MQILPTVIATTTTTAMPVRSPPSPDLFDSMTLPPQFETETEMQLRIQREAEEKRRNDQIDEEINLERKIMREENEGGNVVKVLLLGQTESGKSTTLKNFQLMADPEVFRLERASWRAVIQLNIVRSFQVIFEAIHRHYSSGRPHYSLSSESSYPPSPPGSPPALSRSSSRSQSPNVPELPALLDPEIMRLRLKLMPLLRLEDVLARRLTDTDVVRRGKAGLGDGVGKEVEINSNVRWKDLFSRFAGNRDSFHSSEAVDWNDPTDPGRVFSECADAMKTLWGNSTVQNILHDQNVRLEEMAGFFLDSLDEVTEERYIPSNDHILRARLKTLGVSEHRIRMASSSTGKSVGKDWRIFDVGGHRSLRASWIPYFDDMDAIIFLAPISAFDQVLDEAPKVNRLEDTVLLWTSIVSSPLLSRTDLILFLNKCDIMKAKLESGIQLKDYVVSYGDKRQNTFEAASAYLRKKMASILKENSPTTRPFYCHMTSVVDTSSTSRVISTVKDMYFKEQLRTGPGALVL